MTILIAVHCSITINVDYLKVMFVLLQAIPELTVGNGRFVLFIIDVFP